jgi:general secretion pathway protein H
MEMMVVIAVMGLILLLVTGYGPPRSHKLEMQAAAQQVAQAMRAARGQAIAQGQPVKLTLPKLPAWLTATVLVPSGGPNGSPTGSPTGSIAFAPDGSTSGGSVELTGGGQDVTVSADWLTGSVQINDAAPAVR